MFRSGTAARKHLRSLLEELDGTIVLLATPGSTRPWSLASGSLSFEVLGDILLADLVSWSLRARWRHVGSACVGSVLLSLPWTLWLSGMKYGERYGERIFDLFRSIIIFVIYITQIHQYVLPIYLVAVPLLLFIILSIQKKDRASNHIQVPWHSLGIPVLFPCTTIIALACISPAPLFRYVSPVIPAVVIIAGVMVNYVIGSDGTSGLLCWFC